jgi:predicted TPR repeat methyltransferase
VRDALAEGGFEVVNVGKAKLRKEYSAEVHGLVVVARRRPC